MQDYHGFTARHRNAVQRKLNKAIQEGIIENPCLLPCEICGQDKGAREWHCTDYSDKKWRDSLRCLCWRCHRMLHAVESPEHEGPQYRTGKRYFENLSKGARYDPVYTQYYTRDTEEMMEVRYGNEDRGHADQQRPVDRRESACGE